MRSDFSSVGPLHVYHILSLDSPFFSLVLSQKQCELCIPKYQGVQQTCHILARSIHVMGSMHTEQIGQPVPCALMMTTHMPVLLKQCYNHSTCPVFYGPSCLQHLFCIQTSLNSDAEAQLAIESIRGIQFRCKLARDYLVLLLRIAFNLLSRCFALSYCQYSGTPTRSQFSSAVRISLSSVQFLPGEFFCTSHLTEFVECIDVRLPQSTNPAKWTFRAGTRMSIPSLSMTTSSSCPTKRCLP